VDQVLDDLHVVVGRAHDDRVRADLGGDADHLVGQRAARGAAAAAALAAAARPAARRRTCRQMFAIGFCWPVSAFMVSFLKTSLSVLAVSVASALRSGRP
jgi:hypothetical protein